MRSSQTITAPQVFAMLGITPTPSQAWSVGSRVATMYAERAGHQPPKDNRRKTSGSGSHCFAVYPPSWLAIITSVINTVAQQTRDQGDLFPQ